VVDCAHHLEIAYNNPCFPSLTKHKRKHQILLSFILATLVTSTPITGVAKTAATQILDTFKPELENLKDSLVEKKQRRRGKASDSGCWSELKSDLRMESL
jgi:hypothetical protein